MKRLSFQVDHSNIQLWYASLLAAEQWNHALKGAAILEISEQGDIPIIVVSQKTIDANCGSPDITAANQMVGGCAIDGHIEIAERKMANDTELLTAIMHEMGHVLRDYDGKHIPEDEGSLVHLMSGSGKERATTITKADVGFICEKLECPPLLWL